MVSRALRLLVLIVAAGLASAGAGPAWAQDDELEAMAAALKDTTFTLQDGLKAGEREGQPISAYFSTIPPTANPIVQGNRIKPATALTAPIAPRSLAPTQTVIPTMFGPGISWQRVKVSANSCSFIHWHCSTTTRRAQTSPPPKPHSETLRKPLKRALSGTRSPELLFSRASSMASPPASVVDRRGQRG